MSNKLKLIKNQLAESSRVKQAMIDSCSEDILEAVNIIIDALNSGNKVMWCGNGGSAADSQHLSTELLGRLNADRDALASLALTTDTSFLTAWSNDYSFETIFSRQIESLGKSGDVLLAISTSGNSANILKAVDAATVNNIKVIIFTGKDGGELKNRGDVVITIPSSNTQNIQEGHITAGHIICDLVEQSFL